MLPIESMDDILKVLPKEQPSCFPTPEAAQQALDRANRNLEGYLSRNPVSDIPDDENDEDEEEDQE